MMMNDEKLCEMAKTLRRAGYTVKEIAEAFGLREGTIQVITHG